MGSFFVDFCSNVDITMHSLVVDVGKVLMQTICHSISLHVYLSFDVPPVNLV